MAFSVTVCNYGTSCWPLKFKTIHLQNGHEGPTWLIESMACCSSYQRSHLCWAQVTDVSEARDATGRNNSLMLSTPTGRVCYVADSETEQVEWLSALEGSLANIMKQVRLGLCLGWQCLSCRVLQHYSCELCLQRDKLLPMALLQAMSVRSRLTEKTSAGQQIAGVEDEPTPVPAPAQQSAQSQWAKQLEKSYGAASSGGGGGGGSVGGSRASDRNTMVKIVGYNADSAPGERGQAPSYNSSDYSAGSSFGYDNIAGVHALAQFPSPLPPEIRKV